MSGAATSVRMPVRPVRTMPEHPLVVRGTVMPGDQRGRLLGFPTANITAPHLAIADSVWAGTVDILAAGRSTRYAAAVSIGRRPTYYGRRGVRLLEAHLLDFSGDLYGLELEVCLEHFLRLQQRFSGSLALQEQVHADIRDAHAWAASPARRAG